ncbi:MAG: hypothetical protein V3W41_07485 [Planctomycetota bacterium]
MTLWATYPDNDLSTQLKEIFLRRERLQIFLQPVSVCASVDAEARIADRIRFVVLVLPRTNRAAAIHLFMAKHLQKLRVISLTIASLRYPPTFVCMSNVITVLTRRLHDLAKK